LIRYKARFADSGIPGGFSTRPACKSLLHQLRDPLLRAWPHIDAIQHIHSVAISSQARPNWPTFDEALRPLINPLVARMRWAGAVLDNPYRGLNPAMTVYLSVRSAMSQGDVVGPLSHFQCGVSRPPTRQPPLDHSRPPFPNLKMRQNCFLATGENHVTGPGQVRFRTVRAPSDAALTHRHGSGARAVVERPQPTRPRRQGCRVLSLARSYYS